MTGLFTQLTIATAMVIATVVVHLTGLALLVRALRAGNRLRGNLHHRPITVLTMTAMGLVAIHTVEIWGFAALYYLVSAAADFEQSLYFSTVTYATIGYGDITLAKPWRILGAIEGATGVIMLGWSTAFLVSLLARMQLLRHDWLTSDRPDPPCAPEQL